MNLYEVILRPLTTEKTVGMRDQRQYVFQVRPEANKHEVRQAVERIFEVDVDGVNVINIPAKRRRAGRRWIISRPPMRKAVVTLAPGQSIRALESV